MDQYWVHQVLRHYEDLIVNKFGNIRYIRQDFVQWGKRQLITNKVYIKAQ